MGFFNNLLKLATDVVVTPLAIVKDVVTFGEAEATGKKITDIKEDFNNLIENE